MEKPAHNPYWGPMVRDRLGDDLEDRAAQVQELLDHPGWVVVDELLQAAAKRENALMTSARVLSHGEYIGVSRTVHALHVAREAPHAVLFEAQRKRELRQREAESAARGREEA